MCYAGSAGVCVQCSLMAPSFGHHTCLIVRVPLCQCCGAQTSEEELVYSDFCTTGASLAAELKNKHGCQVVIALTHMRMPNDRKSATIPGVDLILGGHDHDYFAKAVNGVTIVKSGTDFRDLSEVRLRRRSGGLDVTVTRHSITSSIPKDPDMAAVVHKWAGEMENRLDTRLGGTCIDLECRFNHIRRGESNITNFVADRYVDACSVCMYMCVCVCVLLTMYFSK